MRRPLWFMLALSLAALAALAATAPPSNHLGKALEMQRQLTVQRWEDAGVWNDYGNLLLLARRGDEAEAAYRHAVELDPKKVSALFNLGLLDQQKGRRKEALARFQLVVELDPQHAWANFQIGFLRELAGKNQAAIDAYSRAFALDPQLAFRDVNPQVLDSKLVTQAMLKAYREGAGAVQAPKIYDEPGRIAGLLVTPAASDAADAANPAKADAKADAAAKAPKKPAAQGTAPATAPPGVGIPGAGVPPPGTGAKGTVLSEGTIERGGAAGQVLPPGQARRPPSLSGPSRSQGRTPTQPWVRPNSSNVDEGEEDGTYVPPPPPVRVPPSAQRGIYQPGVPSTGRLDLQLVPGRAAQRATFAIAKR